MHNYLQNAIEGIDRCQNRVRQCEYSILINGLACCIYFSFMYFLSIPFIVCLFWVAGIVHGYFAYTFFNLRKAWIGNIADWQIVKDNAEILENLCHHGNVK